MSPEDKIRLTHMLQACETLARIVEGKSRASLDQEEVLALAVARAIEILGEAASRISASTRQEYPQAPWSEAVGIRNRLIHAYFSIDHDILWKAATVEVPLFRQQLAEIAGTAQETGPPSAAPS